MRAIHFVYAQKWSKGEFKLRQSLPINGHKYPKDNNKYHPKKRKPLHAASK